MAEAPWHKLQPAPLSPVEDEPAPALAEYDWPGLLRRTCQMLANMPAGTTSALSVTGSLAGLPGEGKALLALSSYLAEEHGFQSFVTMNGHCFTVRFTRQDRSGATKG